MSKEAKIKIAMTAAALVAMTISTIYSQKKLTKAYTEWLAPTETEKDSMPDEDGNY